VADELTRCVDAVCCVFTRYLGSTGKVAGVCVALRTLVRLLFFVEL